MKRSIVAGFVLLFVCFGWLVAQSAAKKREFVGNAAIQICAKDQAGKWQIVDELTAAGLKFQFSVADVVGKKPLSTDFAFSGRTKKGLSVSARLKPGATGSSDLKSGLVELDLPLELTVDGKRAETIVKFTTESAQGALGNISGRRAVINEAARSAKLGMVSSTLLKDPAVARAVINHEEQIASRKVEQKVEQKKESIIAEKKLVDELMIVINGDGTLFAK